MVTFNNYFIVHADIKSQYDSNEANKDGDSMHIMNGMTYSNFGELRPSIDNPRNRKLNNKISKNRLRKERPVIESCNDNVSIKNGYNLIEHKISACKNNKRKQGGNKDKYIAMVAYGHKIVQK